MSSQITKLLTAPASEEPPHSAAIRAHVLATLGRPAHLREVQVRLLWEGHYRVNVVVGATAADARVSHSYFLTIDEKGKPIRFIPPLIADSIPGSIR
jgi:hypothetical protein